VPTLLQRLQRMLNATEPLRILVLGYVSYVVVGWLLLSLPVCREQNRISAIDNLFVAASAVSTTGLATVNTPVAYSFWGELVILVLFQVGGLGYMTLGSFVILARQPALPDLRQRVARAAFALPDDFRVTRFLREVVVFSLIVELLGAASLYAAFRSAGVPNALWPAIFHSASAFCTAGFSVFPDSLEQFRDDFWVNLTVSVLSVLGAIGFLVMSDVWGALTGARERTTLTTRIILHTTAWCIGLGWILLFLVDPSLRALSAEERLMSAGFQSMTAVTTVGFNTHPMGQMGPAAVLVTVVLMIIGASPAGTGGGLKSTSLSAALAVMWSVLRGSTRVTFWGRSVPPHRLFGAFAAVSFYLSTFLLGSGLLLVTETHEFSGVLFEAASALGTVGLSRGITVDLSALGKIVVIMLMLVGRVGPLTFGLAFFTARPPAERESEVEDLVL
jgi:trk system potassium uptake protein